MPKYSAYPVLPCGLWTDRLIFAETGGPIKTLLYFLLESLTIITTNLLKISNLAPTSPPSNKRYFFVFKLVVRFSRWETQKTGFNKFHDWCHIIVLYPSKGGELVLICTCPSSQFGPYYVFFSPKWRPSVIHAVVFVLSFCDTFFFLAIKLFFQMPKSRKTLLQVLPEGEKKKRN